MAPSRGMFALVFALIAPIATAQEERRSATIVEPQLFEAISALPQTKSDLAAQRNNSAELTINREQFSHLPTTELAFDASGRASIPFVVPSSVIVLVRPDLKPEDLTALIEEKGLRVTKTYAAIGAFEAEFDPKKFYSVSIDDNDRNSSILRGVANTIEFLTSDPRIISATPNTFIKTFAASGITGAPAANAQDGESVGWGLKTIEAPEVWPLVPPPTTFEIGIIDSGFGPHEDLNFANLSASAPVDDHGNHVAGIACAIHGNHVGIKGVLPNCSVVAITPNYLVESPSGNNIVQWNTIMGEVLATFIEALTTNTNVEAFNISLGYNWYLLGINPDQPDSGTVRGLVEAQGRIFLAVLQLAERQGQTVFSAAGNDSQNRPAPVRALYASPFNWAAIVGREKFNVGSGIVVEAYGENGQRLDMSNVGGHIACPGENIESALAFDQTGAPSQHSYGPETGTSMATPMCAAGFLLLKKLRPAYDNAGLLRCIQASPATPGGGAPMLRLADALRQCPYE